MAVSPDFYGANQLAPYPFRQELQPFTRAFVDASVTIKNEYVGQAIRAVYIVRSGSGPPQIEVMADSDTLIDRTDPVVSQVFGAYELWSVSGVGGYGTFVVDTSVELGVYDDSTGLELIEFVINAIGGDEVTAVQALSVEAAGPGQLLILELGSHMEASIQGNQITLSAIYREDGPCVPKKKTKQVIRTINGIGPDADNNFQIYSSPVFIVDNYPETHEIGLLNTADPCCDCEDYEKLFNYEVITHDRLQKIRAWQLSNQTRYTGLNSALKFQLRSPIVDTDLSADYEAECDA